MKNVTKPGYGLTVKEFREKAATFLTVPEGSTLEDEIETALEGYELCEDCETLVDDTCYSERRDLKICQGCWWGN